MKKTLYAFIAAGILLALAYFAGPYQIKAICYGDVCPQNGGTYLVYRAVLTEEECIARGATPLVGIGWVRTYAGCSPDSMLARLVAKALN